MARDAEWRKKELSLEEVLKKYPDVPPIWALKVDVQRRGVIYTPAAKERIDPDIHQVNIGTIAGFRTTQDYAPESLILRDGSYLITNFDFAPEKAQRDPYVVDVVDDKIVITDQGKVLEEVSYWEKPDFYDKKASNGEPMKRYATARPQRIDIYVCQWCHFWDKPKEGCKYCPMAPNYIKRGETQERYPTKYIAETVKEAFKQKGRFSSIMLTGGSILSGKAKHIGYEEWKRRLYAAVDVFGKGNVSSGVVLGTELATPNGFETEEEAYKNVIEQAEEIISHGIALAANVWRKSIAVR